MTSDFDNVQALSHNAHAALALAHHMADMGAARVTIPVELNNQFYTITISKSRNRRQRVVKNPPVALSSGTLGTNKQSISQNVKENKTN